MILIDYIFIFVTLFYSLLGLIRGFSKQLISLVLWVILFFIIFNHLDIFISMINSYIDLDSNHTRIITIILLIFSTIFLIYLLNMTLSKIIALTIFENSDRLLGSLASFLKAQIYILLFILLILDTSFYEEILNDSYFVPYYLVLVEYISNYDDSLFNSFKI